MPSASAFAIMPRCLISLRKTWQRLHKTRRFVNSLPDALPLRIWSIWHSFSAEGVSQWKHLPPSRSQTLRRVSCHISRGCRFLGIFTLLCQTLQHCAGLHCAEPYHALLGPAMLFDDDCIYAMPRRAWPRHAMPRRAKPCRAAFIPASQTQPPQTGPCRSCGHYQSQQSDQHRGGQRGFDYR